MQAATVVTQQKLGYAVIRKLLMLRAVQST